MLGLIRLPLSCTDRDTISRAGELFAGFAVQADAHPAGELVALVWRRTAAACRAVVQADHDVRAAAWEAEKAAKAASKAGG
jgi:hypothetical protein